MRRELINGPPAGALIVLADPENICRDFVLVEMDFDTDTPYIETDVKIGDGWTITQISEDRVKPEILAKLRGEAP